MPSSLNTVMFKPEQKMKQPNRLPRRGYSLLELLVVMSVVILLTGLLLPTLASVRDAANRVISKSNQRNIGQAISLFADSQKGDLPESAALRKAPLDLGDLMRAWTPEQLEVFDPYRKHACDTDRTLPAAQASRPASDRRDPEVPCEGLHSQGGRPSGCRRRVRSPGRCSADWTC